MNSTAAAGARSNLDSLRIFLSYWGNPKKDPSSTPGNRTVSLTIKHAAGSVLPATAAVYQIGGGFTEPHAEWIAMGSPAQPTSSQMASLMKASQIGMAQPATVTTSGPTQATVTVEMVENSAIVLAF